MLCYYLIHIHSFSLLLVHWHYPYSDLPLKGVGFKDLPCSKNTNLWRGQRPNPQCCIMRAWLEFQESQITTSDSKCLGQTLAQGLSFHLLHQRQHLLSLQSIMVDEGLDLPDC